MSTKEEVKDVIRDFVNFDIEKNYYQKADKEEIVANFKEILFADDTTVRQFLKSLFEDAKKLADKYSLIAKEGEATEEPTNEPNNEQTPPEETVPESYRVYRKLASNMLYE